VIRLHWSAIALFACAGAAELARGAEPISEETLGTSAGMAAGINPSGYPLCDSLPPPPSTKNKRLNDPDPEPEPRHITSDDYPLPSWKKHSGGRVIVRALITDTGSVGWATIACSSGFPRLDHAALGLVEEDFRYKPARLRGRNVAAEKDVQVFWAIDAEMAQQMRAMVDAERPRSAIDGAASGKTRPNGSPSASGTDPAVEVPDNYVPPPSTGPGVVVRVQSDSSPPEPNRTGPKRIAPTTISSDDYPEASRKRGDSGMVLLNLLVAVDGRVADAEVLESSGHPRLDEAAIGMAIEDWEYEPAQENGHAVAAWVKVRVDWGKP
jgi:TonB family protein